jgi:AcrR family transcriptional regulator
MSSLPDEDPRFSPPRPPSHRPGPIGGRRHANRLAKIQALCEGALRLFLAHGLDRVSIGEIAEAADVPKGSFYRYFQDKPELVAALLAPVAEPTVAALQAAERALAAAEHADGLRLAYATLTQTLLSTLPQQADVVRLFLQERHGPPSEARAPVLDLQRALERHAVGLTEAAMTRGLLQPADPEVSALLFLGATTELVHHHLRGPGLRDPIAAGALLVQLALEGIGGRGATP